MLADDALQELRSNLLRDVSTLKTGPEDRYWTDLALIRYMNDAHSRFARRTLCLRDDATPELTQVVMRTGVDMYTLHPAVIQVMSVRHQDDNQDMVRVPHTRVANTTNVNVTTWDYGIIVAPGKPTRYNTDEGVANTPQAPIRLRLIGKPDVTQDKKKAFMRVIRKPLVQITTGNLSEMSFETPEDYDLDVLEWAAYRALRNWDLDAEDRQKAEQHKARFEEAVRECRQDVERKTYNQPLWQFGGGGFGGYTR